MSGTWFVPDSGSILSSCGANGVGTDAVQHGPHLHECGYITNGSAVWLDCNFAGGARALPFCHPRYCRFLLLVFYGDLMSSFYFPILGVKECLTMSLHCWHVFWWFKSHL